MLLAGLHQKRHRPAVLRRGGEGGGGGVGVAGDKCEIKLVFFCLSLTSFCHTLSINVNQIRVKLCQQKWVKNVDIFK